MLLTDFSSKLNDPALIERMNEAITVHAYEHPDCTDDDLNNTAAKVVLAHLGIGHDHPQ